ncbi:MAG TPA: phenylalanine--tRNA ligase subunit beta [Clostridiaceae bacterium]|jgi:phenylalanyl-tRNA synthetase beta chain|nr:phenylalanine--tRNA ligase subunit beta [Clostridiaceae bacterium]
MILSRNFVKDYIDLDDNLSIEKIAQDMTRVGNEYDSAEKFINATNLVIGQIKTCEEHPDSDHLHVCMVDVGDKTLQIVCGAPNARAGIKVIVALVGANLPNDVTIKKGTIRGVESNGMMCSIAELGLDNKFLTEEDKKGICELGQDAIVGEDPIKYLGFDDEVIDFELTANRGDLLSMLGMAYELGAIYNKKVKDVDINYKETGKDINQTFNIDIQTNNCSVFLAKKVENVEIKESPAFIKNRLMACGIRPINNVVDISNYVMLELGQPLHFYDADKLNSEIIVRMAKNGEKLTTLDNIERTLDENDIVISTKEKSIGLAGVMGGLETEVVPQTKNIIIESAIFDGVRVRKTAKKILRSEASNRFEKGLDSNRTYMAINRACHLLEKYANGTVIEGMCTYDQSQKEDKKIEITFKNITDVLGTNISNNDILDVFTKLGFSYEADDKKAIVSVPRRRLDISIKEDLIEEVGRIYGVDNIEGKLPVLPVKQGSYDKQTREIRNKMVSLGLNETLSMIFTSDKEAKKYTTDDFEVVKLLDPLAEERNALRYSLIPSMVKIYEYNKARENKDVCIFEIGKGFYKKQEEYGENQKIVALMTGKYYLGVGNSANVDFYVIKGVVEELLNFLGYENRYTIEMPDQIPNEFHKGQTANINVNGQIVGIVGKLHPEVTKDDVYVMEINLDELLSKRVGKMKYKEISKFPNVKKDVAFVMKKDIPSVEVEKVIKKAGGKLLTNIEVFDVYTGENIGKDEKSVAYSLTFNDSKKTLTEEEITKIFENIIANVEKLNDVFLRK